jgi:preprotein translocase subunit SecA
VDDEEDEDELEGDADQVTGPQVHVHDHPDGHDHPPHIHAKGLQQPKAPQNLTYTAPSEDGDVEVRGQATAVSDDPYVGASRNAECPCGSGKKYKKCHGAPGGPTGLTARANG